jgi:hypothetical protein
MRIRSSKNFANPAVWAAVVVCVAVGSRVAGASIRQVTQAPAAPHTPPIVKPKEVAKATEDPSYKPFLDRVTQYIDLRKKLDDGLPHLKPTDEPQRVETHEQLLAARIKAARSSAKPGDIFGTAGTAIKAAIRDDTETRSIGDIHAAMQEVPPRSAPAVNATYPEKAALATVPPLLLLRLPRLPDGLEYRFLGRDLILHDTTANIVVDILREAAPNIQRDKIDQNKVK